ncbi:MAG: hypothetical protein M0D55_01610 [Elusimicrobiota bacterium]|nr:MAG: hypothetical protein M0D55_01610 [Elusimicrobiota bacterium]
MFVPLAGTQATQPKPVAPPPQQVSEPSRRRSCSSIDSAAGLAVPPNPTSWL